ncbi:MAG: tetratricopeptide repeat protein [Candidatus Eremiobacteraeota bacterium]|nr:tetratricopeptide repeat protein [Candidatus Eremiobacteraeota bacterium]
MKHLSPMHGLFLLLSIGAESSALFLFMACYEHGAAGSAPPVILAHGAAALCAAIATFFHSPEKRRLALFAFVFLFTVPLAGYVALIQMLYGGSSEVSGLFIEYRRHVEAGMTRDPVHRKKVRKALSYLKEGYELEPLSTTLVDADPRTKLNIIKSLGKISGPETVRSLKSLIDDPHMDVRYFAGEEIAKIAEFYSIIIGEMKSEASRNPRDARVFAELGSLHLRHALSGLFEGAMKRSELERAAEALGRSIELKDEQYEAHFMMGRLLLFRGDIDDAVPHLRKAIVLKPGDIAALTVLAECFWEKRDFLSLNDSVKTIEAHIAGYKGDDKPDMEEFIASWKEGHGS